MMNISASDHNLLMALKEDMSLSQIELAERSGMSRTSVMPLTSCDQMQKYSSFTFSPFIAIL